MSIITNFICIWFRVNSPFLLYIVRGCIESVTLSYIQLVKKHERLLGKLKQVSLSPLGIKYTLLKLIIYIYIFIFFILSLSRKGKVCYLGNVSVAWSKCKMPAQVYQ